MSKSYHATRKDLKGKTKQEIDAMVEEPDSVLHELAEKSAIKKEVKKKRKEEKEKTAANNQNPCAMQVPERGTRTVL